MTTTKWLCDACKFILGFTDGITLRIKRKDLYIEVEGGRVVVTCVRCGKRNELIDDKFREAQEASRIGTENLNKKEV